MGNIKHFDEKEALDQIAKLFWKQGYAATSLDELVTATGVKRQSLYNAFGKKEQMFLKAYEHYLNQGYENLSQVSQEIPFVEQMEQLFSLIIEAQLDPQTPSGCWASNSAVEFGECDSEIKQRLQEHFHKMEEHFHERALFAQRQGELNKERDIRALAQFLVAQSVAISMMYRCQQNEASLQNLLKEILLHIQ